ncbi:MAG: hypothetical protein ACWGPR_11540 [Candidatus Deferrimicrobiaceae bacterium]
MGLDEVKRFSDQIQALLLEEQRAKTRAAQFDARRAEVELESAEALQKYQTEVIAREKREWKKW